MGISFFNFSVFKSIFNISLSKTEKETTKNTVDIIREGVCDFQILFPQFACFTGEKIIKLKKELDKQDKNMEIIQKTCSELTNFLDGELENICIEFFNTHLRNYFKDRSIFKTRICLKAPEDGNIIDLVRARRLYKTKYRIGTNTGFSDVYNTGEYYLCNNIPCEVKAERYNNPRLDLTKALLYNISSKEKKMLKKSKLPDEKWSDCWLDNIKDEVKTRPRPQDCYKSTLIIPMTLVNSSIRPEFKEMFKVTDDAEKSIYGFLCFDNHEEDYFNEADDVNIGFIFADMISLYLMANQVITEYSPVYKMAQEAIMNNKNA